MERPMVDPAVLRRFSAGAARYEAHAYAQRLSALDLLAYTQASLGPARPRRILEPGCGTGLYTRMLLDAFPAASILGIDVSEAMIRIARKRIDDQGRSGAPTGRNFPGSIVAAGGHEGPGAATGRDALSSIVAADGHGG